MKKFLIIAAAFLFVGGPLFAQGGAPLTEAIDETATPWLKGVEISPYPTDITPVLPMSFYLDDGSAIPATLTEDIPFMVTAESAIFDEAPPAADNGAEIPNPAWSDKPAINWHVIDWEQNTNIRCDTKKSISRNQMLVKPTFPTSRGAITCHIGRRMSYDAAEPGRRKSTFANSSRAADVRVIDITPPTCGLEISVKNGSKGSFWVEEAPKDKYPLPKTADLVLEGALFGEEGFSHVISGCEMGADITVEPEEACIRLSRSDTISLAVLGSDNYKIDSEKLKFGICSGAGGEPAPIGPQNSEEIDLSELELPRNLCAYVDASDTSGNRQVIFIPIKISE